MRAVVAVAAALAVAAGLSGCAPAGITELPSLVLHHYRGVALPDNNPASSDDVPAPYWVAGRRTVALTTYGSSSCPVVPRSVEAVSATEVGLELATWAGACTADLAATTVEFALPASVARNRAVRLTLRPANANDGSSATTVTLRPSPVVASRDTDR